MENNEAKILSIPIMKMYCLQAIDIKLPIEISISRIESEIIKRERVYPSPLTLWIN